MPHPASDLPICHVIGLMSGTSVDSVDAACIRVQMATSPVRLTQFSVVDTLTLDFPTALREELLVMMASNTTTLAQLCELNVRLGRLFAEAAHQLKLRVERTDARVDLIASHGQTVWHIPPVDGHPGSTLQLGTPAVIAEVTGCKVIADFRPSDMAAGGHGAPLVPFADQLLFQHADTAKACQNIGGIANVTALPALYSSGSPVMAFDTGPGNMLIDAFAEHLFDHPYDPEGQFAAQGQVHPPMLTALCAHHYFQQRPPKSTGRELFGKATAQDILHTWEPLVSKADLMATITAFTAETLCNAYRDFILPVIPIGEVILGGGGVFNRTLIQMLEARFSPLGIALRRHEDYGISSKYKEAIAFALLGYASNMGISNNIPSCTGATHPVVMGGSWTGLSNLFTKP